MKIIYRCVIGVLAVLVIILLGTLFFQIKGSADMRKEITELKKQKKTVESDVKSAEKALEELNKELNGTGQEEQEEQAEQVENETQEAPAAERNGKKVAIDPGHQGYQIDMSDLEPLGPGSQEMREKATRGTEGGFTGVPEYELNLTISKQLEQELQRRGYEVMLTRQDHDTAISSRERALLAANFGADIYIRIHANESADPSVSGALTMVPSAKNPYIAQLHGKSYALGEAIIHSYCQSCNMPDRGVMFSDDMSGTNWSQIPVAVLEMGYMTNQNDDTNMQNADFQVKMVEGIANGIDQYFAAGN